MREVGIYRMAPALVVRLAGGALVLAAALVVVTAVVAAVAGWPPVVVGVVAAAGAIGGLGHALWLRRGAALVRLDAHGYRIRFLRGAGPRTGSWAEVREVVASSPGGVPCLVLHRRDGRDTVVPVRALDADPDAFADDVVARLRAAGAADSRGPRESL